jgi:hypothetical protein
MGFKKAALMQTEAHRVKLSKDQAALMQTDENRLRLRKLSQFTSIFTSVYINAAALMQTENGLMKVEYERLKFKNHLPIHQFTSMLNSFSLDMNQFTSMLNSVYITGAALMQTDENRSRLRKLFLLHRFSPQFTSMQNSVSLNA